MSAEVVEVTDVRKSFRIPSVRRDTVREHVFGLLRPAAFEELRVLDGVSFRLAAGKTLGIMGRNGSGKSTLLKIICGIYRADAGHVRLRAAVTPILELGIGWNPELDAIDNILLLGTTMGLTLGAAREAVDEVLEFAGLARFARLELKHYSTGMASRLAYAVAFRAAHGVLVLDEVFAVGDAGFRTRCERRYRELVAAGHSGILVSHEPRAISEFCDSAILLEAGRVVLHAPGGEVASAYLEGLRGEARREAGP